MRAESKELTIGRAGQYLVLADLLLAGFPAFPTAEGMGYDIVCTIDDHFCRLQVRTTRGLTRWPRKGRPKNPNDPRCKKEYSPVYFFHLKRAGRGAKRLFEISEFEGFALVALDSRKIGYFPFTEQIKRTVCLRTREYSDYRPGGRKSVYIEDLTLGKFADWFREMKVASSRGVN